ncbi:hypothetical protein BH11BAC7_BH11BAC7_08120 [soil metagenome]
MVFFVRCFIFLIAFSFVACGPRKVCSGLNPEIGKYNTSQKLRKGRRKLHSGPEKEAYHRRTKQIKKRKSHPGKSGSGGGLFSFQSSGAAGWTNNQLQQKD